MTIEGVRRFMRASRYAVQASGGGGGPQAAVVGIAVTDALEIVFDTLAASRKAQNLRRDPRIAFVIGDVSEGVETTVQYEGTADEPSGSELERLKAIYFERFPDGRDRQEWPGIIYVRVTPHWIRFSDFSAATSRIVEFGLDELRGLAEGAGKAPTPRRGTPR